MKNDLNSSVAIVLLSCDKYSDIWDLAAENLILNWGKLEYPLYFITNELCFDREQIRNIQTGKDHNWSDSLKMALARIPEDYIFLQLDDLWLIRAPDPELLQFMLHVAYDNNLSLLHFREVPPNQSNLKYEGWGIYPSGYPYSCNVNALWKKSELQRLLVSGESAWEFEIYGSKRIGYAGKSGYLERPAFDFVNLIEKGFWTPSIRKLMKLHKIPLDLGARRSLSVVSSINAKAKGFYFRFLIRFIPFKTRVFISDVIKKLLATY